MSTNDISRELAEEQLIRSYFLGDLPESEEERIQQRLFTDPDFFESLLIVEDELVDDYVLGLISGPERAKLERGFLTSTLQHRKVEFVRTLDRYIANNRSTSTADRYRTPIASFFPWIRSRFLRMLPSRVSTRKVSDRKREQKIWERSLREAQTTRVLLFSLIDDDWLGLEILLHLKTSPKTTQTHLASLVKRDNAMLTATLSRLLETRLVDETEGNYSCSSRGSDILERIKEVTNQD